MISKEQEAEIRRLYYGEHWTVGTICEQTNLHRTTIQRVLHESGADSDAIRSRPSIADPYEHLIIETLAKYPNLRASRIWQMARERGYQGGPDHFRKVVSRLRPRPSAEAFLRLRTLPGEQAQTDWARFGNLQVGSAQRQLWAFVMVLSWSRQIFLQFCVGAAMANFLRGHTNAFTFFGGVPRVNLYDNLKSAVLERVGDIIRFHPTLLDFSTHYRFEPRPVAVARGNEKGRVERAIRYARDSFFAARKWTDLADLNQQAYQWSTTIAAERRHPEERSRTVGEVYSEERSKLMALPENEYATEERMDVNIGKTPYARFDLNDYSVPAEYVRSTLTVSATPETVRLLDGTKTVATHARSWDKGMQIEDPSHIEALVQRKSRAHEHRGLDKLTTIAPASKVFLQEIADRGGNLASVVKGILRILEVATPEELEDALLAATENEAFSVGAVRHIIDHRRSKRGLPPPISPRLGASTMVRTHPLSSYDALNGEPEDAK